MEPFFNKFVNDIKLTSIQRQDAMTKYNGVCKKIHEKYYPDKEYDGSTKLLVGSYGKKTNIRPPGDVDVIFKMPETSFIEYDEKENGQSCLLQDVRSVLKDVYETTDRITAFGKVVVVHFSEGAHDVEILPAWQQDDGSYVIPDTSEGGSWETWNPIADIDVINESEKNTSKTKSLIRLLKKWKDVCQVDIDAYKLEMLTVLHLKHFYNNDVENILYQDILKSFFEHLLSLPNQRLEIPSGSSVDLGSLWYTKVESALKRINKAIEAESAEKHNIVTEELRKVFGGAFPKVEQAKVFFSDNRVYELTQKYPSLEEQFIDRDLNYDVVLNPQYSVSIDTRVDQANGFRSGSLLSDIFGQSGLFKLVKNADLSFFITSNNVPGPYLVYWKVRNFGDEARRGGQLRGEIYKDGGGENRKEGTKYFGIHYVECYIIKNSKCVAIGRIPVPIG